MDELQKNLKMILGFVLLAVSLLVIGLFLGRFLFVGSAGTQTTTPGAEPQLNAAQVGGSQPGDIEIPGFESMTFQAGSQAQAVKLENPEANSCYMVFSIMLPDGRQIYQSGMIAPGQSIETIYLDVVPDPGVYENAALRYDCYPLEGDAEPLNGAEVNFRLEVIT